MCKKKTYHDERRSCFSEGKIPLIQRQNWGGGKQWRENRQRSAILENNPEGDLPGEKKKAGEKGGDSWGKRISEKIELCEPNGPEAKAL